jgi:hypothetical protein
MSEEEFDSVWDDISVPNPCISWEACMDCEITDIVIWPIGKQARVFPACLDCGMGTYTIVVWTTSN